MASQRKDVVQGTLDLLVLRIIAAQPMHGWGVMQRLRYLTEDVFQVTPGSLFPALRRLEDNGWASGSWDVSENVGDDGRGRRNRTRPRSATHVQETGEARSRR